MKKTDASAFGEFMTREAQRFSRDIVAAEIATWFETFNRTTLEDFKLAWEQHRKDQRRGMYFPTINDLMRMLRVAGDDAVARDWRCSEEINGERCGFPGGINSGHGWQCMGHYRLHGTEAYTTESSLQIIDASREYRPPKTPMELMERGAAQRAASGERWRKANENQTAGITRAPLGGDGLANRLPAKRSPEAGDLEANAHVANADTARIDAANRELALASEEARS
jgi:hypothetical protein